jgi:hypothetical protein
MQLNKLENNAKSKLEDRIQRVKRAYRARGSKLAQAWELTKEALVG